MVIKDSILDILDVLPSAERRLADVVLSHMGQLATYSAQELAEKAGVSAATAVRFFRRLGFNGFNEFRVTAREQMGDGAPFKRLHSMSSSGIQADMTPFINADVQNISTTFQNITEQHLDNFTQAALKARRIWVFGFRNGQILACYAHSLLQQLRPDVHLAVGTVAHLTEQLADVEAGDLALVMDFRRRSVLLPSLVEHLRGESVQMAFLTDGLESSLQRSQDIAFTVAIRGEYLFDSHTGTLSLINYLVSRVALQAETQVARKLQKIESIHRSFQDLKSNN